MTRSPDTVITSPSHSPPEDNHDTESQAPAALGTTPAPVPKLQLISLCFSRVVEPLAYTQIFPYINSQLVDLGYDGKAVGVYSGAADSAFAFAQLFTVYGYGSLSDRIGRKPVVLLGTFGVSVTAALFGLSTSFPQMMVARTLAGLLSGYVAVLHSILGEITDETNQSAAYPIYALCYPIGSLVGPLVGGALAKPNENIPHLVPAFLHNLFDKYPYMLPSMAASTFAALSFSFVFIFMNETLPSKLRKKQTNASGTSTPTSLYGARGRTVERGSTSSSSTPTRYSSASTRVGDEPPKKVTSETDALLAGEDEPHKWTAWELLKVPEVRRLCRSAAVLSFLAESYVVVFVLFSYTKIQYGGLGFDPAEIGFVLATAGGISFALQLLVLPFLLKYSKPHKVFKICMFLWPIGYSIPPILNAIARFSSDNGKRPISAEALVAIWMGIWGSQILTKTACMSYAMNMIIARQSAPDKRAAGATNGLNQLSQCLARMFAPVCVSTLFALSAEHNLLGGHMVWIVMVILSFVGWMIV